MTTGQAYLACRTIARREARNFYWAFRVLPPHKRNAMCALYAFMRRADDIADDESRGIPQRRQDMSDWMQSWYEARSGGLTHDPIFVALADTQERFGITDVLLEQLVRGTTMDIQDDQPGIACFTGAASGAGLGQPTGTVLVYETFGDLYRYCFLVASVVGLVSIRVFGYSDKRAEALAEKTGIAFQLTNILRDLKEDAERGRIYLPVQDLDSSSISFDEFYLAARGLLPADSIKPLLRLEADRAERYYEAAHDLLPLIDRDSRGALWVLVAIYRTLLERIVAADFDVFSSRISVPTSTKLRLFAVGLVRTLGYRMTG